MPQHVELQTGAPRSEFDLAFLKGMLDRMGVSFYKYGPLKAAYPHDLDAIASLKVRLARYEEDGNTEWLMDVANFAMIEFMRPRHPQAHYAPQDSDTSPGRVTARGSQTDARNGDKKLWL